MRNLRYVALKEVDFPVGLPLTATAWDASNDSVICAFGPTPANPVIELKRKRQTKCGPGLDAEISTSPFEDVTSWDALCPLPDLACDKVLLLQYFSDTATACLVLAGGDLIVVREDPQAGEEKIEIVGSVDAGISAAAWAPDEEVLAIVTRADQLVLMSRYFEPVSEVTLSPDDLKASKHVSVGWGKKETQFQGKRAKALRDPTMPESVDEGKLSPHDDSKTTISWRGDGAFIAINRIVPGSRRVIRVYTREGLLDSASEPADGLESALSWRPSGNLISGIQRFKDRIDVVFFERNGLRHGQFPLRLSKEEMESWAAAISLSWNVDSTVLAISFKDRVQLWTMGNYHYYLKQEIPSNGGSISGAQLAFRWHPEKSLRCSMQTADSLLDLEFAFVVNRGSTLRPHDHGIVAVIDGKILKLTPLKHAAVPPPMSYCEVAMDNNIIDCAISLSGRRIAVLTSASVEIYEWDLTPKASTAARKVASWQLSEWITQPKGARYTQVVARQEQEVILLRHARDEGLSSVMKLKFDGPNAKPEPLNLRGFEHGKCPRAHHPNQGIFSDVQHQSVWYQDEHNVFAMSDDFGLDNGYWVAYDSLGGCPWTEIVLLNSAVGASKSSHLGSQMLNSTIPIPYEFCKVSLSSKGELFAGRRLLARSCTSFLVTDAHLLFTTSQHLLKFVHLTAEQDLEVPGDLPEVDERCRSIERGAKLVTVTPSTYAVTLQMPRGNLETIYPRALVLAGLRRYIDEKDYKSAFLACLNHQVDMNILHDYRPDLFMANIPLFIDQVKKVSRIDDFLSKLKDEDVTQTLYKDTLAVAGRTPIPESVSSYPNGTINGLSTPDPIAGKVNRICDAFLSYLAPKIPKHLQNLVTAHVCKRPPDLRAGLELVASLRQKDTRQAEAAIEHLCFLNEANKLYDTALSLYDLELTLLVAQQSQRDPREYMPFLQSLHSLPALRRQFQIDDYLRNYAKALEWLHTLSAHDEVESYTIKHNLYTTAIRLYKYDPPHLSIITALYASYLHSQSRYADAAIAYESLDDFTSAYQAYTLAHHWREALACATLVPLPAKQLQSLAQSLATNSAEEFRDYRSAATIYLDYLSDVGGAARLLCKGSYFGDAVRILALHGCRELIPEIIDAGLTEKFGEITELLADCKAQLNAQVPRIQDLRLKKAEDPLAFFGGDAATAADGGANVPDNVSLAPTDASTAGGQSLFTRYGNKSIKFGGTVASNASRKTSKTRRREERKRARGKKGSVYEDEYLVNSVGRLIERVNGVQDEVRRLVEGMLRRGMRERAEAVDEAIAEMVRLCENARKQVWEGEEKEKMNAVEGKGGGYDVNGEGRPPGADGVFWDSQMESQVKKEPPEVKVWKGVGLLGVSGC